MYQVSRHDDVCCETETHSHLTSLEERISFLVEEKSPINPDALE